MIRVLLKIAFKNAIESIQKEPSQPSRILIKADLFLQTGVLKFLPVGSFLSITRKCLVNFIPLP